MQPLKPTVIGFCLIAALIGGALATDAPTATLNIEHVVHFQSAEGADLALEGGRYSVEAAMPQGMRLSTAKGKPVIVPATVATHEEKLTQPQALLLAVGTDEQHLILLLPDGMRLEAIGSLSGIRSRGLAPGPSTISNVALQAAVMQLQPAPTIAPAPAPAPAPMPVVQAPVAAVQTPLAVAPPVVMMPQPSLIPTAGPPPSGVTLAATPLVAYLAWDAMPGAVHYAVWRGDGPNVSVERTPPGFTGTQFQDVVPDPRLVYRYSIVAYYPNGTSAEAPVVQFISPPMINPRGFTAQHIGNGSVLFNWQPVPGAILYRLDGPGAPNTGVFVRDTNTVLGPVPLGPDSWRLVALYPGNYADYPGASVTSTVVRVLPLHSQPWLSKAYNVPGLGQLFQVQTPAHQEINDTTGASPVGNRSGDLFPTYDASYATWLGQNYQWRDQLGTVGGIWDGSAFRLDGGICDGDGVCTPGPKCVLVADVFNSGCNIAGLRVWLNANTPLWDQPEQASREAVYGNPGDLGVGRRAYCEQKMRGAPEPGNFTVVPGIYTVCYATAHGAKPGEPGFNDPYGIRNPNAGVDTDFILSMVIIKDQSGTVFLALGKGYALLTTVGLDTEGQKPLPFVCMSCHGGRYNPSTRKVDGASFLPLNPGLLAFASDAEQSAQEEKIRNINLMIHNSDPNSAIGAYIRGLYNGALGQPGARAQPDYVPAGWAPQAGFYRQVVRPYCTMCHLAQPGGKGSYNFASWGNFQGNAGAIYGSVCAQHTMPHSELQYKAFWTRDTGPLYLPGLLAWTLGFPSCP